MSPHPPQNPNHLWLRQDLQIIDILIHIHHVVRIIHPAARTPTAASFVPALSSADPHSLRSRRARGRSRCAVVSRGRTLFSRWPVSVGVAGPAAGAAGAAAAHLEAQL
jgi:hypothetical protein